tara:strand:- start:269 stop:535 length:267 start_codon:yes stop_codon:yes gene_type:complete
MIVLSMFFCQYYYDFKCEGIMSVGFFQILLVIVVVLLLFGTGRVGRLMAELGQGVRAFKKGYSNEDKEDAEASQKKLDSTDDTPKNKS